MIDQIKIGDLKVKRLGLGTNRLTKGSAQILDKALVLGINFFDSADVYTGGQSEETIAGKLYPYRNVVVATKGGMTRSWGTDARGEHLLEAVEGSLKRLKKDQIDLYFLHRVDTNVPFKESLLALKQKQDEGKIKYIGLSEVSVEQIKEAQKYIQVSAVEDEYSLGVRRSEEVLRFCESEGIAFLPYYPLEKASRYNEVVEEIAKGLGVTQTQVALAWLLQKSRVMLPIPGTLDPKHLEENVKALNIELDSSDMEKLNSLT